MATAKAKVPSVQEFMDMHRLLIKEKVEKFQENVTDEIKNIRNAKPEDLSQIVRDKLEAKNGGLSYSSLKHFRKSPIKFIDYLQTPFKQTPAMFLGNVVDQIVTQPEKFNEVYYMIPEKVSRASNEGKAIMMLYEELAGDKIVLTQETYDEAVWISEALFKNADAKYYLDRVVKAQEWISFTHKATGLKMRGALDGISAEEDPEHEFFILDLKTAADASKDGFVRNAANLWYQGQVGTYTLNYRQKFQFPSFIHVVVESKAPYAVNVFRSDPKFIKEAQIEVQNTLMAFRHCLDKNLWHQSYDFLRHETMRYESMELPGYYKPIF